MDIKKSKYLILLLFILLCIPIVFADCRKELKCYAFWEYKYGIDNYTLIFNTYGNDTWIIKNNDKVISYKNKLSHNVIRWYCASDYLDYLRYVNTLNKTKIIKDEMLKSNKEVYEDCLTNWNFKQYKK